MTKSPELFLFETTGLHAFRHGCNRRWELAGLNPAVLRQHGSQFCGDDGSIHWRNPSATGQTGFFQTKNTVIGKYGK
jgi:hypothetical protein